MVAYSAGLLPYRVQGDELLVFVVHMGGPLWATKDAAAWSVAKGLYDPQAETPLDAARREFAEEVGVPAPDSDAMDLGELRLSSGKRLRVFAVEAGQELAWVSSSTFTMQWPPRSGRIAEFPEIDGGAWFRAADAAVKLVPGQRPFLQRLADRVGWGPVR